MLKTFEVLDGFHYDVTNPSVPGTHAKRFEGAKYVKSPNGQMIKVSNGDLVQSEHDLDVAFPQKFQRFVPPSITEAIPDASVPSAASSPPPIQQRQKRAAATPPQSVSATASVTADDADDAGPVGKDVTTSYPAAMEQDYKVYLHRGQCTLYNGDDLAVGITKPLNANPVPTDQVNTVVAKLLRQQPV